VSVAIQGEFAPVVNAAADACRAVYGPRLGAVALYGSVARGTARPDSDIDLYVVVRDLPAGRLARSREFAAVEERLASPLADTQVRGLDTRISAVLRTPAEVRRPAPLLLDMVEDAIFLVEDDSALREALDRLRARLRELGSKRVWCGTRWYWDLAPNFRPGDEIEL
jgi:predicted nucleotidyltransferase